MRILHLMSVAAVALTMAASPAMAANWKPQLGKDQAPKSAVAPVAPVFAQNGNSNEAPTHAGGVRPAICDTSGPTSGYNRPGGFCDIAANPRSLSGRVVGITVVNPGAPGSPATPYLYYCVSDNWGDGGYFTKIYNRQDGKKGCYN